MQYADKIVAFVKAETTQGRLALPTDKKGGGEYFRSHGLCLD